MLQSLRRDLDNSIALDLSSLEPHDIREDMGV